MSGYLTIYLLITVFVLSSNVHCLRCFWGIKEEGNLTILEIEYPIAYMCAYEAVGPCNFTEAPIYHVYKLEKTLMDKCTGRNGEAICTCTTDLCNGNMTLIKEQWDKSDDVDEDIRECVSTYIAERESFPSVRPTKAKPDEDGFARIEKSKSVGTFTVVRKMTGDSPKDFWIFLALLAVATLLIISLIPALICCMVLRSQRKRKFGPSGGANRRSGRHAGGRSLKRKNYQRAKSPSTAKSSRSPFAAIRTGWSHLSQKSQGRSSSTTTPGSGSRTESS